MPNHRMLWNTLGDRRSFDSGVETTDQQRKRRRGQSFLTLLLVRRDGAFRCFVWVFRSSSSSLPTRSVGVLRRTSSFSEVLLDKGPANYGCKRLKRMIREAVIHLVQLISQVSLRLRASSYAVLGFFIRLSFLLWIRIPSSGRCCGLQWLAHSSSFSW